METNKIYQGDCLELMKQIEDKSVDLILCDLPYGVTQNKKDICIDLNRLWKQYLRVIKDKGIIVLTAQQPFTTDLINSNKEMFKYDLIWDKVLVSGFLNAKKMPLRTHEHILIFYKKLGTYNPQFWEGNPLHSKGINYKNKEIKNQNYGKFEHTEDTRKGETKKYPTSILKFIKKHPSIQIHPTEKSIDLFEYLIKTYTNKGDLVLDNCIGSGTTAVACKMLKRKFIGIELSEEYCKIANERIQKELSQSKLNSESKFFSSQP